MFDEGFVLVVDDNNGIRHLLNEILTQEGFRVKTASNGIEALQIVSQSLPLMVLLDSMMPGMNGLEVLKKLKHISLNLPVIMITAYAKQPQIIEALDNGQLDDFITKPFDLTILQKILNKFAPKINRFENEDK